MNLDCNWIVHDTEALLKLNYDTNLKDATAQELHDCLGRVVMMAINDTWNKSKEITVDDGFASVNVKLKKAATVTQVAVHCMNAGYFSYQYSLGVCNPVY